MVSPCNWQYCLSSCTLHHCWTCDGWILKELSEEQIVLRILWKLNVLMALALKMSTAEAVKMTVTNSLSQDYNTLKLDQLSWTHSDSLTKLKSFTFIIVYSLNWYDFHTSMYSNLVRSYPTFTHTLCALFLSCVLYHMNIMH